MLVCNAMQDYPMQNRKPQTWSHKKHLVLVRLQPIVPQCHDPHGTSNVRPGTLSNVAGGRVAAAEPTRWLLASQGAAKLAFLTFSQVATQCRFLYHSNFLLFPTWANSCYGWILAMQLLQPVIFVVWAPILSPASTAAEGFFASRQSSL